MPAAEIDRGSGGGNTESLAQAIVEADLAVSVSAQSVLASLTEFKGAVNAALAEARSLFSHIITEGSSQQARIHGERSAAVSAIESARNQAIAAIHGANDNHSANGNQLGDADSPTIRRPPKYLVEEC